MTDFTINAIVKDQSWFNKKN